MDKIMSLEELIESHAQLLRACQLAYRKVVQDRGTWTDVEYALENTLAHFMGEESFAAWIVEQD